jgi:hypothetical protein
MRFPSEEVSLERIAQSAPQDGSTVKRVTRSSACLIALVLLSIFFASRLCTSLPCGDLPGIKGARLRRFGKRMWVRVLHVQRSTSLAHGFYDRELVSSRRYLLQGAPPLLAPSNAITFLAHCSRSGSTLLTRMLDARGDVIAFREPTILTLLVKELAAGDLTSLPLVRAVLASFLSFSSGKHVVVKLPSCLAKSETFRALNAAAPMAQRVGLLRPADQILGRHKLRGPHSAILQKDDTTFRYAIERKASAIRDWANALLMYADVVNPEAETAQLCTPFGLAAPRPDQAEAMLREQKHNAKSARHPR